MRSRRTSRPKHFEDGGYAGDVWTWIAIDADTKLIPSFMLGQRDPSTARAVHGRPCGPSR